MTVIPDLKTLYEIDDSLWLEETIKLLKAKKFQALDLENLAANTYVSPSNSV